MLACGRCLERARATSRRAGWIRCFRIRTASSGPVETAADDMHGAVDYDGHQQA